MTNQTFDFEAITDQDLVNATGGGAGATLGWVAANVITAGLPIIGDALFNGAKITKAAQDA